mmetsp:Transcript_104209/g.222731  ORF Transcript_104209/g.222731 Transcript_104209/m.222731 type:complete len:236 (+) Transcript_104209:597-1304(+)
MTNHGAHLLWRETLLLALRFPADSSPRLLLAAAGLTLTPKCGALLAFRLAAGTPCHHFGGLGLRGFHGQRRFRCRHFATRRGRGGHHSRSRWGRGVIGACALARSTVDPSRNHCKRRGRNSCHRRRSCGLLCRKRVGSQARGVHCFPGAPGFGHRIEAIVGALHSEKPHLPADLLCCAHECHLRREDLRGRPHRHAWSSAGAAWHQREATPQVTNDAPDPHLLVHIHAHQCRWWA